MKTQTIQPKDVDDDLVCYYDETGELPTEWEQVTFFDEETDLAVVSVDGIYGAVNRNGETVIPLIYHCAMYFSEGLLAVKKNDKWGYVNKNHNIVIPFEYENLRTFGSAIDAEFLFNGSFRGTAGYFRNGETIARKNGNMGFINTKNEIVFPFLYKEINSATDDYLCVSHDKLKYGIVNFKNEIILPFIYDHLSITDNDDYVCFGKQTDEIIANYDRENGQLLVFQDDKLLKFGIINLKGEIIIPAVSYSEIKIINNGKAMCFDYYKDECFVYDSVTKEIIYAPDYLLEDETECVRINFIRNLVGIGSVPFSNIE